MAEGLEVHQQGEHEIIVDPGIAIDRDGREIVLSITSVHNLSSMSHDSVAYITIKYKEETEEEDHVATGGVEGYVRISEGAEVHERREDHIDEGAIVLAKVRVGPHGHIEHVDMSGRKMAKEAASPVQGWLRLPFKPVRLNPVRIGPALAQGSGAEHDFIIDEANAYCDKNGARGSMQIPVPPGAAHVSGFRIAGSTLGEVTVRLYRTGWNVAAGTGEKTKLLEETLINGNFHKEVELSSALDESHALAVSVRAENESVIWLVAVKFN